MESITWRRRLRRWFVAEPEERRGVYPWIAGFSVLVGVMATDERDHFLYRLAVTLTILAFCRALYELLAKRPRRTGSPTDDSPAR